jgi:hypothetical protein
VKLAVRRVYDFGTERDEVGSTLLSPEAWDAVRRLPGAFRLPETREEWLAAGSTEPYISRAAAVVGLARECGARSLCSHGVGTALLEQQVQLLAPELALTCTDFAPGTLAGLRSLFEGVELVLSDLRDVAGLPEADLHLMHRLDQELSREEWHRVFASVQAPLLFVPSEILTPVAAVKELVRRVVRPRATSAGLFRNEAALRDLWSPWFDDRRITVADEGGFLLTPK